MVYFPICLCYMRNRNMLSHHYKAQHFAGRRSLSEYYSRFMPFKSIQIIRF